MASKRRFKFSQSAINKKAVPPPADSKAKDVMYFDDRGDPPGLGIRVGRAKADGSPPTRTWILQLDVRGKTKRWSVGRFPTMGLEAAREVAREWYLRARKGDDPTVKPAEGATLRDAFERHVRIIKQKARTGHRQPRSVADAEYDVQHYWGSYLDRELHSFSRMELHDIHARLSDKNVHGPAAADRACKLFRAAWRNMMLLHETLPDSPTVGIMWNGQQEERKPLAWEVMPEFWRTIGEIRNPVRADLVRVLVLTGLRSLDARTIEWEDIAGLDGDVPTLHRPNPKGGPRKAFTVPVSSAVAEVFRRRRAENETLFPESPLVFPTIGRDNRVTHIKNAEEDSLRGFGYTPHIARHTFASACSEAGLSALSTKALLNHRSKDITEGYQHLSMGHLRKAIERVTAFLLEKARGEEAESEAA